MRWIEYFTKDFLNTYNKFFKICNSKNFNKSHLYNAYVNLVFTSCTLIMYYFNYNGLITNDKRYAIRTAYRYNLIQDGEKWINAYSLAEAYSGNIKAQFVKQLILEYCSKENTVIFKDLKKIFENLVDEYEQNS